MSKEQNIIEEILGLWCSITGMDFNSNEYTFSYGKEFNLSAAREDLKSSLSLDESGLTTLLLLEYFVGEFFQSKKYTLQELLEQNDSIQSTMTSCKKLRTLMDSPEIKLASEDFKSKMKTVLEKLAASQEVFDALDDSGTMGYLRRDALKSINTLSIHQFTQGDTTSTYLQPSKDIFLFWNMAAAVRLGLRMQDGVFLGLIRDQFDYASFFVLVAKNGGTLTVFTDAERDAHPLQKNLSRRPERDLSRRSEKHHFPYSLLDSEFDYKDNMHPGREGVVPFQEKPIIIGHLNTLAADELLWLLMVFSLIDQKLFKCSWTLPTLSYCSDVLREQSTLLGEIQNLPAIRFLPTLELPQNTLEALQHDSQYLGKVSGEATPWGITKSAPNQWLLDLYKDKVPDSAINGLLKQPDSMLMLSGEALSTSSIAKKEYEAMSYFAKKEYDSTHQELQALTGDEFGTKEQLEQDYRFLARYNEALYIKTFTDADFQAHKEEVYRWIRERITQQKDHILSLLVNRTPNPELWKRYPSVKAYESDGIYYRDRFCFLNGSRRTLADSKCFWSASVASFVASFHPTSMEELLTFFNCTSISELPFWLQHWTGKPIYTGNHILQRIDPMNWVVKDHWAELCFYFTFFLSKRTFNQACKKYELPAIWDGQG